MRRAVLGVAMAVVLAGAASAQGLRPAGGPLLPSGAGGPRVLPPAQAGVSPLPAPGGAAPSYRPPIDLYPAALAGRVAHRLPALPGIPPEKLVKLHARVLVQLAPDGSVTVAEVTTPSGEPAFDAAVLETLAGFTTARGAFGPLPLPNDDARKDAILHRGLPIDIRPLAPAQKGP